MKKALKWSLISLTAIIGLVAVAVLSVLYMLGPERLTPLVNKYATQFLDAQVSFNAVELSLFEEFPKLSVKIIDGQIISHAMRSDTAYLSLHPQNADTLVQFHELMVSLNSRDLLRRKVSIQRIRLSQPTINGYVSPSGRANWEIYEADTSAVPDTAAAAFDINIDRFSIRGPAKITFRSEPDSVSLNATIGGRLHIRGALTPDLEKLSLARFRASEIDVDYLHFGDSTALQASVGAILMESKAAQQEALQRERNSDTTTATNRRRDTTGRRREQSDTPPRILDSDEFSISDIKAFYRSPRDTMTVSASVGKMMLKGNFVIDTSKLDISSLKVSDADVSAQIGNENINARISLKTLGVEHLERYSKVALDVKGAAWAVVGKERYADSLPLSINGALSFDLQNLTTFGLEEFGLSVDNLPYFRLNGNVALGEDRVTTDLGLNVASISVQRLMSLVPRSVSAEPAKIRTNIELSVAAKITGDYVFATGSLPVVTADVRIPRGHVIYRQNPQEEARIDNFAIDASVNYDHDRPRRTSVRVRSINVEAAGATLRGNINATNILRDPNVTLSLNGTANLRELMKFVPAEASAGITARGNISFNADGRFLVSRLNERDLAKNDIVVKVNADRVRFRLPQESIGLLFEKTFLELNTTRSRTSRRTGEVRRQISIDFKSDSARIRMPSREIITVSKLDASMRSSDDILAQDTAAGANVVPMSGTVTAGRIEYTDVDSQTVTLRELKTSVRLRGQRENRSLPSIRFETEVARLGMRGAGSRYSVRDAAITLVANKNDPNRPRQRRQLTPEQLDSLQLIFPDVQRDSLQAHSRRARRQAREEDEFAADDINLRNPELGNLLRTWALEGNLKSRSGRVTTPEFPIRIRLQNVDLDFTSDSAKLNSLSITAGDSRFDVKGRLDNIRRAMSSGRGLRLGLEINSDSLNIDQLLTAAYEGAAFAAASDEYRKAVAGAQDEEELEKIMEANAGAQAEQQLIVVPSNVSLDARINVRNGKFADISIDRLSGAVISRDRVIQLNDIVAQTSVGEVNLTALYATRNPRDITVGLDLEFKDIQVEDFVKIVPSVDSLAPMLLSMAGVINAQIAATAALDTTMNVVLPTLNAACRIRGENMVLLDGETFAEIAKLLRFRNRERNLVENISAELLIRDNQMQIFPFIMQMDRYRVAISGIQHLDMTFNYHISVLESPLPFRIGINIMGNLDDLDRMRFRLGRARYRDANMPTSVTLIDATRLNLRTQIDNFLQLGVDAARFSSFEAPQVDMALTEDATLTAQDSLELYRQGIIDTPPQGITDDGLSPAGPPPSDSPGIDADTPGGGERTGRRRRT